MMSATMAAQNGDRFKIADIVTGCALLRPKLYSNRPLMPIAKITASFP